MKRLTLIAAMFVGMTAVASVAHAAGHLKIIYKWYPQALTSAGTERNKAEAITELKRYCTSWNGVLLQDSLSSVGSVNGYDSVAGICSF